MEGVGISRKIKKLSKNQQQVTELSKYNKQKLLLQ